MGYKKVSVEEFEKLVVKSLEVKVVEKDGKWIKVFVKGKDGEWGKWIMSKVDEWREKRGESLDIE